MIDPVVIISILFRWVHIISAAAVIGGGLFAAFILPWSARSPEDEQLLRRGVRGLKILIHVGITLLLASGAYNTVRLWPLYRLEPGLLHGLWGLHILLAAAVFGLATWPDRATSAPRRWRTVLSLVLLAAVAATASTLKTLRERAMLRPAGPAEMPAAPVSHGG